MFQLFGRSHKYQFIWTGLASMSPGDRPARPLHRPPMIHRWSQGPRFKNRRPRRSNAMPEELPEGIVDKLKALIAQLEAGAGPAPGAAPGAPGAAPGAPGLAGEIQLTLRPGDP